MSVDSAGRGLAAKALPRSGGTMSGTLTAANIRVAGTSAPGGPGLYTVDNATSLAFTAGSGSFAGYFDSGSPGFAVANGFSIGWAASASSSGDLRLWRQAAGTLAQRDGANAQSWRVYNSYTDASNGEWAELSWSSNVAYLRAQKNGSGTQRLMIPVTGSTTVAGLPSAATAGAGARSFVTDATATTFLSTVAGGGANKVPVVSDGTNWLIG